jgi:ankyrin repeat protein
MFSFLIRTTLNISDEIYFLAQKKVTQTREKILTSIALTAINVVDFIKFGETLNICDGTDEMGRKILFKAIKNESTEKITKALELSGIDVNKSNERGATPLSTAVFKGNLKLTYPGIYYSDEVVEKLLAHPEIDPNIADGCGKTPLYAAVHYGNLKAVEMLLAHSEIALNLKLINKLMDESESKLKSLENEKNTQQHSNVKEILEMLRKRSRKFYMEALSGPYNAYGYKEDEQKKNVLGVVTELLTGDDQETQN